MFPNKKAGTFRIHNSERVYAIRFYRREEFGCPWAFFKVERVVARQFLAFNFNKAYRKSVLNNLIAININCKPS